jgi:hypothetical protein
MFVYKMLILATPAGNMRLVLRPHLVKLLQQLVKSNDLCVPCAEAKITIRKVPKSTTAVYDVPGHTIGIDIFEAPMMSRRNHRYCLLAVCLATGYLQLFFMARKSEASGSCSRRMGLWAVPSVYFVSTTPVGFYLRDFLGFGLSLVRLTNTNATVVLNATGEQ